MLSSLSKLIRNNGYLVISTIINTFYCYFLAVAMVFDVGNLGMYLWVQSGLVAVLFCGKYVSELITYKSVETITLFRVMGQAVWTPIITYVLMKLILEN